MNMIFNSKPYAIEIIIVFTQLNILCFVLVYAAAPQMYTRNIPAYKTAKRRTKHKTLRLQPLTGKDKT